MTLTHELLHAHVRAILASILIPNEGELPEDAARRFAEEHGNNIEKKRIKQLEKFPVLEYLRHSLFEYSDYYYGVNHTPHEQNEVKIGSAISPEGQLHRLKFAFPFINEIIVHCLDLPYFYNDDLPQYLKSLWDSWSTIPGVVDRIDTYLLRSIVAAGSIAASKESIQLFTRQDGTVIVPSFSINNSFEAALSEITTAIADLQGLGGKSVILDLIVKYLADPEAKKQLRKLYFPNLKLAMIAREFLLSDIIRSHLSGIEDRFSDYDEEEGEVYKLEESDLSDIGIANPLRFLQDRLRRGLVSHSITEESEEWKSAWVLHALSSITITN